MHSTKPTTRCAVYTRKSSEEGLEQSFSSLHAQREAFILSQRHEGWSVIDIAYDDGGFSGGTMERPALKALLEDILARAVVNDDAMQITLKRSALMERLGLTDQTGPDSNTEIVLDVPATLRRLGKEKRLIVAAQTGEAHPDATLIKAIARAHDWFGSLKSGDAASLGDIAEKAGVPRSYVGRILPLVFLAPDITEAILQGRQPIDLTLERLLKATPLPHAWNVQRASLGFRAR